MALANFSRFSCSSAMARSLEETNEGCFPFFSIEGHSHRKVIEIGTREAEVLNSLIMKITAKGNE